MEGLNLRKTMGELIEQKLLLTHTAFLGRVTAENGVRLCVQPLTLAKDVDGEAYAQPLVVDAPRLKGVAATVGDVVLCVVCERDISQAARGQMSLPANRRHSLSDSVVVGVIENAGL